MADDALSRFGMHLRDGDDGHQVIDWMGGRYLDRRFPDDLVCRR